MKKYTHLIFDLDNTLLDFNDTEEQALKSVFKAYEIPETLESFSKYKEINKSLWTSLENGTINRDDIFTNRFMLFFKEYGLNVDGQKAEKLYRGFLNDGCKTIENAETLLSQLKKKEYRIYAGTNGMGITQRKRLTHSNLLPYFDGIFISEEIGFEKPDLNFFETIFDTLDITDRDTFLMIGDSLSSDILGAQNARIDSVLFSPDINLNLSSATYEVNDLLQIYSLLEN
ncbi:YjjG family noncanonical pyrimidine nucleotidase [Desemzia sp. RIT804]|uniref:YjjG family noncanonical pyrimidine nucleotidase n=1 Tax=Desemzia sp. RIT 804 TaxID=2810209 RepID=UPI0019517A9B|nr:YjjG family noncanonical pyrimidine nucleotidase [Desemzia sp. RIT 804]MBM6616025.1 YjjG family noncanonical pyrimidine nucleotidase [Desemzia sp. RIT 804]